MTVSLSSCHTPRHHRPSVAIALSGCRVSPDTNANPEALTPLQCRLIAGSIRHGCPASAVTMLLFHVGFRVLVENCRLLTSYKAEPRDRATFGMYADEECLPQSNFVLSQTSSASASYLPHLCSYAIGCYGKRQMRNTARKTVATACCNRQPNDQ